MRLPPLSSFSLSLRAPSSLSLSLSLLQDGAGGVRAVDRDNVSRASVWAGYQPRVLDQRDKRSELQRPWRRRLRVLTGLEELIVLGGMLCEEIEKNLKTPSEF